MRRTTILLAILPLLASTAFAGGTYRAPLTAKAPKIDGALTDGEWRAAVTVDGLGFRKTMEERRARVRIAADASHLYIAIASELPPEGKLIGKIDKDNEKIVHDDSVEVWVDPNPGADRGLTFQMLYSVSGARVYKVHSRGGAPAPDDWDGQFDIAQGFTDDRWIVEIRAPLAPMVGARPADRGAWNLNVCRNFKQPWAFAAVDPVNYKPNTRFVFSKDQPVAVGFTHKVDPVRSGKFHGELAVTNVSDKPVTTAARIELTRSDMPTAKRESELTVPAGETKALELKLDGLVSENFTLATRVASGEATHYERTIAWRKGGRPERWAIATVVVRPVDFDFAHYPYRKKLRIRSDSSGLKDDATLRRLTFTLRKQGTDTAVKTVVFENFDGPTMERTVDVPELDGAYELAMTATGENVPDAPLVKTFERKRFPWEGNTLGESRKVYPPFTPIELDGRTLKTVLREHELNPFGLPEQIVAKGTPIMAAPATFRVTLGDGGAPVDLEPSLEVKSAEADRVVTRSTFLAGTVHGEGVATWDVDGTVKYELTLEAENPATVTDLELRIPLKDGEAPMIHAMRDGIRNTIYERLPEGEGTVWTAKATKGYSIPEGFCTYIYVGGPLRGLSWFAENDRGWGWDRDTPNLELVRTGGRLEMRIHLINEPTTIKEPRTMTFGLLAAPVKPRLLGKRGLTAWTTERYSWVGTNINWLSIGHASEVYPLNKDLYYWKMMAEGNTRKVSREEVREVIERGRPFFEKYGAGQVDRWVRHVRHNVGGGRLGKKMVFYYNRAVNSANEEYATFMNEWLLPDYPPHDFDPSLGEQKIVPSESYLDFAMHWYAKSFEFRNRGVYWDNMFFRPSFNRAMTDAYAEGDRIVPATGLWGLRELTRRTFRMMNEKGMRPITMSHMTSTGILPMLSFCTVQYDWEWKYSTGDVQYRFPREYLLLVSTGELAGTWPVLLHDHGKQATDEWTQRTFVGVCLVHQLIGGGRGKAWKTLRDPVFEIMEKPDVVAWRYWDEGPQPIVAETGDLPTIVYAVPGKEAVAVLCSYSENTETTALKLDPKAMGFDGPVEVTDLESGKPYVVEDNRIRLEIPKHAVLGFKVMPK